MSLEMPLADFSFATVVWLARAMPYNVSPCFTVWRFEEDAVEVFFFVLVEAVVFFFAVELEPDGVVFGAV